jgi:hypothetical protein
MATDTPMSARLQQVLRQQRGTQLALRKSQGNSMKITRGEDNQVDWIKQRDDARSSVGIIPLLPKPKKPRLTKRQKLAQQKLLKPTPIPSDADLIKLRQRYDITSEQGMGGDTFHNVVRVYEQLISVRQELAEIKEMIKEIQDETA